MLYPSQPWFPEEEATSQMESPGGGARGAGQEGPGPPGALNGAVWHIGTTGID